ncbi:MAG: tetratricopeptide repeat protein [Candidatus Latescibacterota bacterium]|nr:tetratricopeptide repeat protein [Candidatus Latescibacterota bacterium]
MRISVFVAVWFFSSASTIGDPVASKSAEAKDLYDKGNFDDALRLYRDAQLERPNSAHLNFNVGNALFKKGDFESAVDEFNQSAERSSENLKSRSLYNVGNALYLQQQYEKAAESYREALRINPNDEDFKANLELALRKMQEQEQQEQEQEEQEQEEQEQQEQEQQEQEQQEQEQQQRTAEEVDQMGEQDAEQLLDALKDREKDSQRRRFRATGETHGKDW